LNPSQPTSSGYQYVIEAVPENDANCFDSGDDIFSPSDPSPTHNSTLDGDSNGDQAIEQPASLVNADVEDASDEITGAGEGIQSRPQQDGNTSGQEDGDQEADFDFEFVVDDVETDSDSEPDLSHEDGTVGIEVIIDDTIQSDSSVAKEFLENTKGNAKSVGFLCWRHLPHHTLIIKTGVKVCFIVFDGFYNLTQGCRSSTE
jgi:hypothetical protein